VNSYTLTYSALPSYSVSPYVFAGVWDISWQSNLNFSLHVSAISTTSANILMSLGVQISVFKVNIMTIDSVLYGVAVYIYSVGPMASPITFEISNHSQYPVIVMTRYESVGVVLALLYHIARWLAQTTNPPIPQH
jgi:hypothetical protein